MNSWHGFNPFAALRAWGARRGVSNIAALSALPKGFLSDGQKVNVDRYGSVKDFGGGSYYWDATATDTPLPGLIVQLDEGGAGRFFYGDKEGGIDIRVAGAACDGSDDAAAAQAIHDYGAIVLFPNNKTTTLNTTVKITTSYLGFAARMISPTSSATVNLGAPVQFGNDATGSEALVQDVFWGDGLYTEDTRPDTTASGGLFDVKYVNTFRIGKGDIVNCHALLTLGDASATGPGYRVVNEADCQQRYGKLVFGGAATPSAFVAGARLTGGTSGAKATIYSMDGNTATIYLSSETLFTASETVSDGTNSATLTSEYRPETFVNAVNWAGAFKSFATVEGAYAGGAHGFCADDNAANSSDENLIYEYWGRFDCNVRAKDARMVNCEFKGDFEGALTAPFYFETTSSTAKAVEAVGWSDIRIDAKCNSLDPDKTLQAGLLVSAARSGVEYETIVARIALANQHKGHGAYVSATAGSIKTVDVYVTGTMTPRATNYAVVEFNDGGGAILAARANYNVSVEGASAVSYGFRVTGDVEAELGSPIHTGSLSDVYSYGSGVDFNKLNGAPMMLSSGTAGLPSLALLVEANTGIFRHATGLGFTVGGVHVGTVTAGGWVPEVDATASDAELLDIADPINTSGKYPGKTVLNTSDAKIYAAIDGTAGGNWWENASSITPV